MPMPVSSGFKQYTLEQLDGLSFVTSKSMFGGVGVYSDGLFFALMAEDRLYLKVDDTNRPDFEAVDMGPFRPYDDERSMQYYEIPADILEDADELQRWASKAIDVARRAKKTKKKSKKKN